MRKTMTFLKKSKEDIPSLSSKGNLRSYNASDWFFAKIKTVFNEESASLVIYDFTDKKWRSVKSGFKEVIEYYVFDERFDSWLHSNEQDIDLLFDVFNSLDECDK